jgi:hypothetical protein
MMMKQEKDMTTDTRDLRLSVEQIRALLNLLGNLPMDEITVNLYEEEELQFFEELQDMLQDALESDPDTLNDFTA